VRPVAPVLRSFEHLEFDAAELAERKGPHVVSVCLPARDEAATVGAIVERIRRHLVEGTSLVDEILVVDDHSTDRTAAVAADAGARVVQAAEVLPEYGEGHGKGEAMWKSLHASEGDLIVWCDADVIGFEPHFVTGLLGPLLTDEAVAFVKGFYARPPVGGGGGGRVTELVARPLLSLLFPQLASVVQPLAGEFAGRRGVLEQLPFVEGYGVDIALLIDVANVFGTEVMAQVDLGSRVHRNRPLDELSPQALAVMQAVLRRAGQDVPSIAALVRPGGSVEVVKAAERPPLATVPAYWGVARGA
jgi:glucosyl-3-phosphoglycerate synthase